MKRDRGMIRVKLPDGSKRLIPKPPIGFFRPKRDKYYNYAEDESGKPYGAPFERDVPRDQYHMRMLVKGDIALAEDKPKPATKPKKQVRNDSEE